MLFLLFFNHQSLIGFFGPQGPSSKETHGLLISITLDLQEVSEIKKMEIKNIFFIE
jgi:hypothetical protein